MFPVPQMYGFTAIEAQNLCVTSTPVSPHFEPPSATFFLKNGSVAVGIGTESLIVGRVMVVPTSLSTVSPFAVVGVSVHSPSVTHSCSDVQPGVAPLSLVIQFPVSV